MKTQPATPSPYSQGLSPERNIALAQTGGGKKPRFSARAAGIGFFDDEIEKPLIDIKRNPDNVVRSEALTERVRLIGDSIIAVKDLGAEAVELFVNKIAPVRFEAHALYKELLEQTTTLVTGKEANDQAQMPEKTTAELAAIEEQRAIIQHNIAKAEALRAQTEVLYFTHGQEFSAEDLGYQGNYEDTDSIYALAAGRATLIQTIEIGQFDPFGAPTSQGIDNSAVAQTRRMMSGNQDNNSAAHNAG